MCIFIIHFYCLFLGWEYEQECRDVTKLQTSYHSKTFKNVLSSHQTIHAWVQPVQFGVRHGFGLRDETTAGWPQSALPPSRATIDLGQCGYLLLGGHRLWNPCVHDSAQIGAVRASSTVPVETFWTKHCKCAATKLLKFVSRKSRLALLIVPYKQWNPRHMMSNMRSTATTKIGNH